jgi:hypothetical protein
MLKKLRNLWRIRMTNVLDNFSLRDKIFELKDEEYAVYFTWGTNEFVIIDDLSKIKCFKVTKINSTGNIPFDQVNAKEVGLVWDKW